MRKSLFVGRGFTFTCLIGLFLALTSCQKASDSDINIARGELTKAAAQGDLARVEQLLKAGANINENVAKDEGESLTPLLAAIAKQQRDIAVYLIRNGAAIHPSYRRYRAKELANHAFGSSNDVSAQIRHKTIFSAGEQK
ncbi:MAG: hypothetical protein H6617_05120 [Bdellovibrionaceae bacterium]|nr:hypothetical protein [Bdellovibrionales bacterium]MCB9254045.1 hypothetical protein [Pseudobdellovibrionaceae bacterium]